LRPTYLDACVIAALLFDEPASDHVIDEVRSWRSGVIVSDFTSAEVSAAVSKRVRMKLDDVAAANTRLAAVDRFRASLPVAAPTESRDIRAAERLVRAFELKLRAPDAIHLAVCLRHDLRLATLDKKLAHAARALGVVCINPAENLGEQKN
jgi:predicted nucleic acid-binding protein